MNDNLINSLVNDLKPTKNILRGRTLFVVALIGLGIVSGLILFTMGIRADYQDAFHDGAIIWKPAIFLLACLSVLLLSKNISGPTGKIKAISFIPIAISFVLLAWQMIVQLSTLHITGLIAGLNDPNRFVCVSVITGLGAFIMGSLWLLWFRHTASPHPSFSGAAAGFAAGSMTTMAYALHCANDTALYIVIYYGSPIVFLTMIGAFLGHRYLKW